MLLTKLILNYIEYGLMLITIIAKFVHNVQFTICTQCTIYNLYTMYNLQFVHNVQFTICTWFTCTCQTCISGLVWTYLSPPSSSSYPSQTLMVYWNIE